MMKNIFNQFDPSNYMQSPMIPYMLILILILYPMKSLNKTTINIPLKSLLQESSTNSMPNSKKMSNTSLSNTFFMIFTMNFMSLLPYSWNLTSCIPFNLSIIMLMWIPIPILILFKKKKNFLIHLIPINTPTILIPFMFIIEMISFWIRPITLNMRLTANMIAGHTMILLLSSMLMSSMKLMFITYPLMIILSIMEIIVAILQAYIIMTLISLFFSEI